jgi:hypothetical protein
MEDSEKEYQEYQENMQKGNFLRQLYFETEYCKISMACTPAWSKEQYKLVK